jgi:hypothetical protein
LVEAKVLEEVVLVQEGTKVPSLDLVILVKLVSREVKCLFTNEFQNLDLLLLIE